MANDFKSADPTTHMSAFIWMVIRQNRKAGSIFPIARTLKLGSDSPFRSIDAIDALEEMSKVMQSHDIKWNDIVAKPCRQEDFLRAWDAARILDGERPLYDSIVRTCEAGEKKELVQFPSRMAQALPRYNFVLNVLMHLSEHEGAEGRNDFYLSSRGLSTALAEAGMRILSFRWVSQYISYALADGYLEQTRGAIKRVRARRFKFVMPDLTTHRSCMSLRDNTREGRSVPFAPEATGNGTPEDGEKAKEV